MRQMNGRRSGVFHVAMVLLVLVIITLCAVIANTWASYPAAHTLTYKTHKLTWDKGTNVRDDGSAELAVFSASYENVRSQKGEKLIAPGTEGRDSIVLRNTVDHSITYTAIAYYIKNDSRIPVDMDFDGSNLKDTSDYSLPAGVDPADVLRAVTGTVAAKSEQNFSFAWKWDFETEGLTSDPTDTTLGDDAASGKDEEVKVGFYIVVQDKGSAGSKDDSYSVSPAKTGDTSNVWLYLSLTVASLFVLILLFYTGREKDKKDKEE